jgi:RNA polymerase sigma factor (TIGR02999 family)
LKRLAAWQLAAQGPGHTLQPTALVHEAFLRLVDRQRVSWRGRAHFLAAAAQAMRHVLVDHARAHGTGKRGGGRTRVSLAAAMSSLDIPSGNSTLPTPTTSTICGILFPTF